MNTHRGLYKFKRLPFGLSSAPSVFQRIMEDLLRDILYTCIYLGDILVTGPSEEAHLQNLERVLDRLCRAGVRLKRDKCVFMAPEVTYLGHMIS